MSLLTPTVLVGGGGHCHSVIDVFEKAGIPIAGVVPGPAGTQHATLSYVALGADENLPKLRTLYENAFVTVGQVKTPAIRQRLFQTLVALGFTLPRVVSPLGYLSRHSSIGQGSLVMHQALINANVQIGDNCIINSKALVEHDCIVGDHCHIAVGAILCGNVRVGSGTFIGAGAVIREGVVIGENCVVAMNCSVKADIASGVTYGK